MILMKKPPIGLVACCVCPFPDAEVKEDRNGCAYIHCPDCNTQTFTRDQRRDRMLRTRMRASPAAAAAADPPVPVTVPERAPPPAATPAPSPAPTPRRQWLAVTTLLDRKTP
jgi:hypothetical protein